MFLHQKKLLRCLNYILNSIYLHSIKGATFKSASFYSGFNGITFESLNSEASINFLTDSSLKSRKNPVGQIINVY